jgi:hypothetical protein
MARDVFHGVVRAALEREGWTITHDPLELKIGRRDLYIDLGAELLVADLGEKKIAVEVKSFLNASPVADFHAAIGQYLNYRSVLKRQQPERHLYLAVPAKVFDDFFQSELAQVAIVDHKIDLIAYSPDSEVLVWKPKN